MKNPWKWLTDYFELSRGERNGLAAVLGLILLLITAQYYIAYLAPAYKGDLPPLAFEEIDASEASPSATEELTLGEAQLFTFDPNTVSVDSLRLLGMESYPAGNIIKYREAGGQFRKAEDLKKIYGLEEEIYNRLAPYISIERNSPPPRLQLLVDLNTADSVQLLQVNGIGPVFAGRIVKYRERLGGFTQMEQLKEVYGITEERYAGLAGQLKMGEDAAPVRKIDLNAATVEELAAHPYIGWKRAKAIVNYRKKHGAFKKAESLENLYIFDENSYKKLIPYVTVQP